MKRRAVVAQLPGKDGGRLKVRFNLLPELALRRALASAKRERQAMREEGRADHGDADDSRYAAVRGLLMRRHGFASERAAMGPAVRWTTFRRQLNAAGG